MASDTEGKQKIFDRCTFKLPSKTSRVIEQVRASCRFRELSDAMKASVIVIAMEEGNPVDSGRTKKQRNVARHFVRALFKHLFWSDPMPAIPPHLF